MTEEQREEITTLAKAASNADQTLHWAGYQNMPREADLAAEQRARYALLQADAFEKRAALEAAIAALGRPAEPWVRDLADEMIRAAKLAAA